MKDWPHWAQVTTYIVGVPLIAVLLVGGTVLIGVAFQYPPLSWLFDGYAVLFVLLPVVMLIALALGALAPIRRRFSRKRQG